MPTEKTFHFLHEPGNPLVLYNIWDAGSAEAVARAGAKALATGSASVAGALGYPDGEAVPLDTLLHVVARIRAVSDLPLTVDFEAGYGETPGEIAGNAADLEDLGVAGINLEDGMPPENGIRPAAEHAERIAAIRARTGLFINARTDLFLQNPSDTHAALLPEAHERAAIYAEAGADGFFAPGLTEPALIGELCRDCPLPVNIMASPAAPSIAELAGLRVARISFGPFPWRDAMASLTQAASEQLGQGA
ncbi:isocitrate lyase/PEP mutase family protein [Paracoccus methylarcula]|uniref:Isocitrate lyase/phosphoenolpyruvate mutase family protein n=1 Tax=Paracoccus methylarcula TaxID=72022 RepID=A0A422QYV9_9RHOB|nr:isocitrate lyase/phosphoenolpyruvate mutase family protein [Paracoccus methylarcula]RNF35151.1 isocitrate lyase/phosphoenolpyruvate mutase family protein [Paracoccus methylarcula]